MSGGGNVKNLMRPFEIQKFVMVASFIFFGLLYVFFVVNFKRGVECRSIVSSTLRFF